MTAKTVKRTHPDVPSGSAYIFDTSPEHRYRLERLGITDVPADLDVLLLNPNDVDPDDFFSEP